MGWLKDFADRMAGVARDEDRRRAFEQAAVSGTLQGLAQQAGKRQAAYLTISGKPHVRISWGSEQGSPEVLGLCPGCQARPGELHRLGCGQEECPSCGAKALGCGCDFSL